MEQERRDRCNLTGQARNCQRFSWADGIFRRGGKQPDLRREGKNGPRRAPRTPGGRMFRKPTPALAVAYEVSCSAPDATAARQLRHRGDISLHRPLLAACENLEKTRVFAVSRGARRLRHSGDARPSGYHPRFVNSASETRRKWLRIKDWGCRYDYSLIPPSAGGHAARRPSNAGAVTFKVERTRYARLPWLS